MSSILLILHRLPINVLIAVLLVHICLSPVGCVHHFLVLTSRMCHLVVKVGVLLLFIEHLQVLQLIVEPLVIPCYAICAHPGALDIALSVGEIVPQRRDLKLLHHDLLSCFLNLRLQFLDLLLVDACRFVVEQTALDKSTARLLSLELIGHSVITISLLSVHRRRLVQTRS